MKSWMLGAVVALCVPAAAMQYDIRLGVRPDAHRLDATVTIRDPRATRFNLNKNFAIQSVTADGKPVAFHIDPKEKASVFTPDAAVVVVETDAAKVLEIRYGGTIEKPVAGVNMITPRLVELALPSAWYPMFAAMDDFSFRLTASMPDGLMASANGKPLSQARRDGRTTYVWSSYGETFDIALVAAPGMRATTAGTPPVEIDYVTMPDAAMDQLRDALIAARQRLIGLYGTPRGDTSLRVFYAPRDGYPYSRPPLVLTSEGYVANDLKDADSDAALFHWTAHELAHYWWSLALSVNAADWTENRDNWLNEGLAEFTALRLVEEQYGKAAVDKILDRYRRNAARNKTSDAIAETRQNSPDQWLNRYERPPLMLFAAREKFGAAKLDAMLRRFYARYAGTHQATTAGFLDIARAEMGEEAAAFLRDELYRHPPVAPAS